MTTPWTPPRSIVQYAEPGAEAAHVAWLSPESFPTKTHRDLLHIARSPKIDDTDRTWYLSLTDFRFVGLPDVVTGIALRVAANRRGRITDETLQLCLAGEPIGKNRADMDLSPIKIYGGEGDLWNTELTVSDLRDPGFGVLLRFQSHPHWPHKDSAILDRVELQIY
jgi:hypothetical protein